MRYDATLKELLQAGTPGLWRALGLQPPQELLVVEIPSVQVRKPDFVGRFDKGAIVHLEIQGDNDDSMEWRELEYYLMLYRQLGQPPIQIVVYIGAEPMRMRSRIANESLQFHYWLVDIRVFNSEHFLESDSLSDAAIALLAEPENMTKQELVAAIIAKFAHLPENEQRDWLEKLMILSGLRDAEDIVLEEAKKMGISLDIRDNKFFQEAYAAGIEDGVEKGMERGMERGMEKGEATMLQRLLEHRFGSLPDWAVAQLEKADRPKLEDFGVRSMDAKRLEDVFNGSLSGTN